VGAWIETADMEKKRYEEKSHPMWVRGLKPDDDMQQLITLEVAPHVGAWIETPIDFRIFLRCMSHPMWVRGLKQSR